MRKNKTLAVFTAFTFFLKTSLVYGLDLNTKVQNVDKQDFSTISSPFKHKKGFFVTSEITNTANPLVLKRNDGSTVPLIKGLNTVDLSLFGQVNDWLQLGVLIPGENPYGIVGPYEDTKSYLGNILIEPKIYVMDGVAFIPLYYTSGSQDVVTKVNGVDTPVNLGKEKGGYGAKLAVGFGDKEAGETLTAIQIGAIMAPESKFREIDQTFRFQFGAALSYPLSSSLRLLLEAYGEKTKNNTPLESIATLEYKNDAFMMRIGGGTGDIQGSGSNTSKFLATFSYFFEENKVAGSKSKIKSNSNDQDQENKQPEKDKFKNDGIEEQTGPAFGSEFKLKIEHASEIENHAVAQKILYDIYNFTERKKFISTVLRKDENDEPSRLPASEDQDLINRNTLIIDRFRKNITKTIQLLENNLFLLQKNLNSKVDLKSIETEIRWGLRVYDKNAKSLVELTGEKPTEYSFQVELARNFLNKKYDVPADLYQLMVVESRRLKARSSDVVTADNVVYTLNKGDEVVIVSKMLSNDFVQIKPLSGQFKNYRHPLFVNRKMLAKKKVIIAREEKAKKQEDVELEIIDLDELYKEEFENLKKDKSARIVIPTEVEVKKTQIANEVVIPSPKMDKSAFEGQLVTETVSENTELVISKDLQALEKSVDAAVLAETPKELEIKKVEENSDLVITKDMESLESSVNKAVSDETVTIKDVVATDESMDVSNFPEATYVDAVENAELVISKEAQDLESYVEKTVQSETPVLVVVEENTELPKNKELEALEKSVNQTVLAETPIEAKVQEVVIPVPKVELTKSPVVEPIIQPEVTVNESKKAELVAAPVVEAAAIKEMATVPKVKEQVKIEPAVKKEVLTPAPAVDVVVVEQNIVPTKLEAKKEIKAIEENVLVPVQVEELVNAPIAEVIPETIIKEEVLVDAPVIETKAVDAQEELKESLKAKALENKEVKQVEKVVELTPAPTAIIPVKEVVQAKEEVKTEVKEEIKPVVQEPVEIVVIPQIENKEVTPEVVAPVPETIITPVPEVIAEPNPIVVPVEEKAVESQVEVKAIEAPSQEVVVESTPLAPTQETVIEPKGEVQVEIKEEVKEETKALDTLVQESEKEDAAPQITKPVESVVSQPEPIKATPEDVPVVTDVNPEAITEVEAPALVLPASREASADEIENKTPVEIIAVEAENKEVDSAVEKMNQDNNKQDVEVISFDKKQTKTADSTTEPKNEVIILEPAVSPEPVIVEPTTVDPIKEEVKEVQATTPVEAKDATKVEIVEEKEITKEVLPEAVQTKIDENIESQNKAAAELEAKKAAEAKAREQAKQEELKKIDEYLILKAESSKPLETPKEEVKEIPNKVEITTEEEKKVVNEVKQDDNSKFKDLIKKSTESLSEESEIEEQNGPSFGEL